MRIKFPETKQLQKTAKSYNRKAVKRTMIKYIKGLKKLIKNEAKIGRNQYFRTFKEEQDRSWEVFVMFRWIRRYSGLNVEITERVNEGFSGRKRYIDEMDVRIKW